MSHTAELYNYYFWLLLDGLALYIHAHDLKFPTSFLLSDQATDSSTSEFDQTSFNKNFINFINILERQRGSLKDIFCHLIEKIINFDLIDHPFKSHYFLIFLEAILEYFIHNQLGQEHLGKIIHQVMHSSLLLRLENHSCLRQHLNCIEGMIKRMSPSQFPQTFIDTLLIEHQLLTGVKTKRLNLNEAQILEKTKAYFVKILSDKRPLNDDYLIDYLDTYLQVLKQDSDLIEFLIKEVIENVFYRTVTNLKSSYLLLFEKVLIKLENVIFKKLFIASWSRLMHVAFQSQENPMEDLHSILTLLCEKGFLAKLEGEDFNDLLKEMLFYFFKSLNEKDFNNLDWKALFSPLLVNLTVTELAALEEKFVEAKEDLKKVIPKES